jgi:hypothetical protein
MRRAGRPGYSLGVPRGSPLPPATAGSPRTLGEPAVAAWWERLERLRRGGW